MTPPDAPETGFELAREPDAVPTPLAIAAADFCRRAGRPSSPEAIRLALARLEPEEDAELRAIVDAEPEARPLGPEALVDLVRGLSAKEAAEREESGYYLALAQAPRRKAPARAPRDGASAVDALARRDEQRQELLAALADAKGDLARAAAKLGLTEDTLQVRLRRFSLVRRAQELAKTAGAGATPPTVRRAGSAQPKVRPSAPTPPPLPKRGAGRPPKGRLTLGTPAARDPAELRKASGKQELHELLTAYKGNRRALLERLNEIFKSPRGPLRLAELDALIDRHGLRKEAAELERENLRFLFTQARGDLYTVASRLKTTPPALKTELQQRGLWDEAERMRDRYRRELFGRPVSEQIQNLLQRAKYLRDLGALQAMEEHVSREVARAWEAAQVAPSDERALELGRRLSVAESVALELVERFKLR